MNRFNRMAGIFGAGAWGAAMLLTLCCTAPPARAANFITVNSTADNLTGGDNLCTLREAINNANNDGVDQTAGDCVIGAGPDTIVLPAGIFLVTITASGEDLNASGDFDTLDAAGITIQGAGAASSVIDGAGADRVLHAVNGPITIDGVTIRNGAAATLAVAPEFGGGLYAQGAATIRNSVIRGNSVAGGTGNYGYGGGIYAAGVLSVSNSAVFGNTVNGGNGGWGGGLYANAALSVSDSTVSGNAANGGSGTGGGINTLSGGTITSSTISGNSAGAFGGGFRCQAACTFASLIISGNTAPSGANCDPFTVNTSNGYNIASDASCGASFKDPTDRNSTDPMLGPLADNGGGTFTHMLQSGSPAIDIYTSTACSTATDQRGIVRPQGSGCDSGALELSPADTIVTAAGKGGCVIGTAEHAGLLLPVVLLLLAGGWLIRRRAN